MKIMKYTAISISLAIVALFSAVTNAGGYVGAKAFTIDTEAGDFNGVNLVGGYDFNDFIGVRGRYMLDAGDETYQGINIELESMTGLDLKLSMPLGDSLCVNVIGGRTKIRAKASAHGYSASASDTFTTYGIGLSFSVLESYSVTAEVLDIDGDRMLSLGANWNF